MRQWWTAVQSGFDIIRSKILTVSEQQAAKRGDGNKDGTDAVEADSEPAGRGQEQEPGPCSKPGNNVLNTEVFYTACSVNLSVVRLTT